LISARAAPDNYISDEIMITLPDQNESFNYENNFYLSCDGSRIAKFIAQYELFRLSVNVPGVIIECGVFKGVSLVRFAHFREIFGLSESKTLIGFDTFDVFPGSTYAPDNNLLQQFIESAGSMSIGKDQLTGVLTNKGLTQNISLIEGDISKTVPEFISNNPDIKISFLNLEPSKVIIENLFPHIAHGGILLLDDYGKFPGETRAVDDYFIGQDIEIKHFTYVKSPHYIVKK
jgi:hypothetical protein